jgi:hypothetical protein
MRTTLVAVFSLCALLCGRVGLEACGDKFLIIGRALKYQKAYKAEHPASVVIYQNPASHVGSVSKELQLEQLLTGAGHKVRVVSDPAMLEQVLRTSPPDLVLADGADIPRIEHAVPTHTSMIVPVLYNPTREGRSAAERAYGVVLLAPGSSRHPLAVIDDALKLKSRRAATSKS